MNCPTCRQAALVETIVWYERLMPDGRSFRMQVAALRCPACGEMVFRGAEAERISNEWYRLLGTSSHGLVTTSVTADNYAAAQWARGPVAA